jgi:3-hydroxyisobutyrate dehydrogenase-like beta-hydroxyacid dehydrogenase
MDQRVGLIGFGAMGSAFADLLGATGSRPLVFDTHPGAIARAQAAGLDTAGSAAEIGERCDVIDLIVRTDEDVLAAVSGPGGITEGARPGSTLIVMSTVSLPTTLAVAEIMAGRGGAAFDACPTERPEGVLAGNNVFLAGGEEALVDRSRPHLLRMGREVIHMGPLGAGNAAKMVHNLLVGAERLILHEALLIGEAAGLPYVRVLEMLRDTTLTETPLLAEWETVFDPSGADPTPKAGSNVLGKDVPLAAELARSYRVDAPITFAMARSGLALVKAATRKANGAGSRPR